MVRPDREKGNAVIHLVKSVHLPATHTKLVHVKVEGNVPGETANFESARCNLAKQGLVIDDGVVDPDKDGCFILPIQNHSLTPVNLAKDEVLGTLATETTVMEITDDGYTKEETTSIDNHIKAIQLCLNDTERVDEIKAALAINELNLLPEEKSQLGEVIDEFADVFALNQLELGHTDVVQHDIDTGDSPPLRQPVRRIPFALRAKVEEMVVEMEKQGVVQPSSSP